MQLGSRKPEINFKNKNERTEILNTVNLDEKVTRKLIGRYIINNASPDLFSYEGQQ